MANKEVCPTKKEMTCGNCGFRGDAREFAEHVELEHCFFDDPWFVRDGLKRRLAARLNQQASNVMEIFNV